MVPCCFASDVLHLIYPGLQALKVWTAKQPNLIEEIYTERAEGWLVICSPDWGIARELHSSL